jgi:hypothetical protein
MQHGEGDVGANEPAPRLDRKHDAVAAPNAVAPDLDRDREVARLLQTLPDRGGRGKRYLVLGGATAAEHRDTDGIHGVGVEVVPLVDVVEVDVAGAVVVVVVVGVGAT